MQNKESRNIGIDVLRIISSIFVVFIHVTSDYIYSNPVGSNEFEIAVFLNGLSRFSVPVFVIISGALFLGGEKEYTPFKLWKNNIIRLFILYIFWSFVYYACQCVIWWKYPFWEQGILQTITGCIYASNHFWFLFMIMGLYALVPMIRTWLKNTTKKEEQYILLLFFVFQIMRNTLEELLNKAVVTDISSMVKITELTSYLGYFILGHYLTKYPLSKMLARVLLALSVIGIAVNYLTSSYLSGVNGQFYAGIANSYGVFVFFQSIAIYHYVTCFFSNRTMSKMPTRIITNVAKNTLGIYAMHICVLDLLERMELIPDTLPTVVLILGYVFLCYSICSIIAACLRRIPYIGKYLS